MKSFIQISILFYFLKMKI